MSSSPSASLVATSSGAGGSALTTDKIRKLLLTDKDAPGYVYDASKDSTETTDVQDVVTSGGGLCQTLADATDALSTKYGTVAEVDRQFTKAAQEHTIRDSVVVLPSVDEAVTMLSDLTVGLKGCKSLTLTQDGVPVSMTFGSGSELAEGGVGYVDYISANGKTVLMATELVRVGKAVSIVALIGPATDDTETLHQMGVTLAHFSDIQVGRLQAVEDLG
ncbi:hypothetical protein GCM10009838_21810 [Catenulispora subtropica]|uniref:PknH-like extracellular domain-containing protein n=1 Tax=Catenulispora subtropica TaxID=450798 RepID=A0ABN2R5Y2_9ACTN